MRHHPNGADDVLVAKIKMALAEALAGQQDVHLLCAMPSLGTIGSILCDWITESPEYTGRLSLMVRNEDEISRFASHGKITHRVMAETLKVRDLHEMLVIGKEIVAIDYRGELYVLRSAALIDSSARIIRTLNRLSVQLLQMKE